MGKKIETIKLLVGRVLIIRKVGNKMVVHKYSMPFSDGVVETNEALKIWVCDLVNREIMRRLVMK
jgi:hypothetical protein